jgi:4-amino-4-deoxy-L-arabinose transferase-like glycosyltransferase
MELRPRTASVGLSLVFLVALVSLSVGLGLGSSAWLTYHEAFVAQGAREILISGCWSNPAIGGLPWLEKPPLPFWLVAACGRCAGEITPLVARLPSAMAALGLVLGVSLIAMRRYGLLTGIISGAIQATTAWAVLRGRLAEADILLACLITWTILAFDRMRTLNVLPAQAQGEAHARLNRSWRWVFFGLLGVMSLVKGIGFGAVMVLSIVLVVLLWDRDTRLAFRLCSPFGWLVVAVLTFAWPVAMVWQHGLRAIGLWTMHITARLGPAAGHGVFASDTWREYVLNILGQGLPWSPLVVLGLFDSIGRRRTQRPGEGAASQQDRVNARLGDRLLCAWSLAPLVLVSLASGRNAHYAIHAMVPWSVWSANGLLGLARRLRMRGMSQERQIRLAFGIFVGLAITYGLGFWLAGPLFDHREPERVFYGSITGLVPQNEPLALLYDDWDRDPYPTPFGPIPHDLGARLFALNRPACWHFDVRSLVNHEWQRSGTPITTASHQSVAIIARRRDLPALEAVGRVEVLREAKPFRWDRNYLLARIWLEEEPPMQAQANGRSVH